MVKAIFSNPIGRKFVATTVFASAVLGANATGLKSENINNSVNQTEVMSKEAASAYKVRVQDVRIQHFEHNKKMDKLIVETCDNHREVKAAKTNADAIYRVYGTYGAMIELQRSLDDYYIEKTFEAYKNHYQMNAKDCQSAEEVLSHFRGWKDNVYYTELFKKELEMYDKTKIPSAKECLAVIDNHIYNKDFFNESDVSLYKEYSEIFMSKQAEKESVQAASDLLAYKVHLLNSIAFTNYFYNAQKLPNEHIFMATMGYEFINGDGVVKP